MQSGGAGSNSSVAVGGSLSSSSASAAARAALEETEEVCGYILLPIPSFVYLFMLRRDDFLIF